ncbi:hypothetical protein GQ53DRAFT_842439 [Thozetella sp. PMI_491]|nr:hypothetical protein GQ53DRAFT_842439 [Thozetella sp. PMI_491]
MLVLLSLVAVVSGLCYTPDGSISNDLACNPSDTYSICCQSGFLCMSNGFCQPPWWASDSNTNVSSQFIRGTCTDKTWEATQCRGFCVKENPSGGEIVYACGNSTDSNSDWCCSDDTCCSNGDAEKFKVGAALVTATAGAELGATSTSSSSSSSSTTTSASGTSSPPAATSDTGSTSSSSSVGLGAGLGVGLGVVAIAGGAFFFFWRRRQARKSQSDQPKHEMGGEPSTSSAMDDTTKWVYAGQPTGEEMSSAGRPVYEAPSHNTRSELPTDDTHQQRVELP